MYNFFIKENQKQNDHYFIGGTDYNHIKNVLRMVVGDTFLVSENGVSNLCEIENFENDINLSKISEKYHFNTCYLGQLFKRKVGVNFNTFLIGVRIAKAKKLLENPEMKIFEISDKVGFKRMLVMSAAPTQIL